MPQADLVSRNKRERYHAVCQLECDGSKCSQIDEDQEPTNSKKSRNDYYDHYGSSDQESYRFEIRT